MRPFWVDRHAAFETVLINSRAARGRSPGAGSFSQGRYALAARDDGARRPSAAVSLSADRQSVDPRAARSDDSIPAPWRPSRALAVEMRAARTPWVVVEGRAPHKVRCLRDKRRRVSCG